MSDFDKEAEREKLREKYERDEAERQATQRMSDLLLKGATMTNAHCGTCGDPLFQMDDTTFCPSCHGNPDAVQGTDLEARPADESATETPDEAAADPQQGSESPDETSADESATAESDAAETPASDRRQRRSSESSATDHSSSSEDAAADATRDPRSPAAGSQTQPQSRGDLSDRDTARRSSGDGDSSTRRRSASAGTASGDLETARDSLVAALESFAGDAAATDDPRYARECLEAAREAAETLEALR